jgi:hypothetical protein
MPLDKILLAGGCSYTDKNFQSLDTTADARGGWAMWPEIVADRTGLRAVNVGVSGTSNDAIFNSILDGIMEYGDRIDTIAVLWTTSDRIPFFDKTIIPLAELYIANMDNSTEDLDRWMSNRPAGDSVKKFIEDEHFNLDKMLSYWMQSTIRKMYELVTICDKFGYKLIMGQGPAYFDETPLSKLLNEPISSKKIKHFMDSPYFGRLQKHRNNIIGWPLLTDLGGWDFDSYRKTFQNTTVSDKDYHPNAYGQQIIADVFTKRISNG